MNKLFVFSVLSLVTASLLLVTNSCSTTKENAGSISLVETSFGEEVQVYGNLSFTFEQNLMPDSMLGFWDTVSYIRFDPAIPGQFKWESSNQLVFSPYRSLAPATAYTATMTKELLRNTKLKLPEDPNIHFHTPDLKLVRSVVYWAFDDVSQKPFAKVDLEFNYPVLPEMVQEKLDIQADGKLQKLSPISTEPSSLVSYKLSDLKVIDKELTSKLTLKSGIKPVGGNRGLPEEVEALIDIPSPFHVDILHVEAQHDGLSGKIFITTSQQVDIEQVEKHVIIEPYVEVSVVETEEGFLLESEGFESDEKYDLTVAKGLPGMVGGKLEKNHAEQIYFGELRPSLNFTNSDGRYLSGAGLKNIGIQIVNIPEVEITIKKIFENNLLASGRYGVGGRNYYDYYYYDDYSYNGSSGNTSTSLTLGETIYEETIETKTLPINGGVRILNLDFKDKLADLEGQYHIEIRSTDDYWLRESRFISISDLGLIAKVGENTAQVWVNSIKDATPIVGAEVKFWGGNNQVVATGLTNGNGLADVNLQRSEFSGFKPAMVTVSTSNDFNYMLFSNTRVNTSKFDVGGNRGNPSGLLGFLYPERDIYRPGETINMAGIVRTMKWKSPGKLPVVIEVKLPNGKEYQTIKKTLNAEGGFDLSIKVPEAGMTGSYSFKLYTSNNVLLNSYYISVEEFMPDRIKLVTEVNPEEVGIDELFELEVTATNFFGPPAVDRNLEVEVTYDRRYFYAEDYPGYDFYIDNGISYISSDYIESLTDESGQFTYEFGLDEYYADIGYVQADVITTVFDETGRSVSKRNTVDIYTQDVFYGIKYTGYYLATNSTNKVPLIAVDKEGDLLSGEKARVQVIKHEYKTVLAKSGSYYRYESQHEEVTIKDEVMTISGLDSYTSFVPKTSGKYEVRIMAPDSERYVSKTYYAYGWGRTYSSSFQVDKEGSIDMTFDKDAYKVGDQAKVLFTAPFDGKMLVTVETKDVLTSFFVETDNKSAEVSLPVALEYLPNAYVTATLIKPHKETDFPLTVAHGFASFSVEDAGTELPMEISAAAKSRSRTSQSIKVQTLPNARVTIAAVDAGILQVTGFTTPDPHGFFYAKRALMVESFDVYPWLFPEISANSSVVGGDATMSSEKRLSPVTSKRVKLVSFWSGTKQADAAGKVNFDIEVQQFSGQLKIMAVGYKGDAFGSTESDMTVADPIVISSSLPRFLSPGDTVRIPVMLANTTDQKGSGKASLEVEGPVTIVGSSTIPFNVSKQSEASVEFIAVADKALGNSNFKVSVDCFSETFMEETDVPVRPASPLQQLTESGDIAGGKDVNLTIGLSSFIPSTVDYHLMLSKSPMLEFADDLEYLVNYPHGCAEQTISAAFPQLYFADLVENLYGDTRTREDIQYNIEEALRKLKLLQLYNGGLSMWSSGYYNSENWWVSAFAAHFCIEAKKAGYDVDEEFLEPLMSYLKNRLTSKETIQYYYNGNLNKKIAPKEVAYSLYVLALANQPQISIMNYYKGNQELLSLDGKYLLAVSYGLAGDKDAFASVLPGEFSGENSVRQSGGSFYSLARDEALALNALLEIDPNHPQIGTMAKHVADRLKGKSYLNTQERIFSLLALGKISREANKANVTAEISAGGKSIGSYKDGVLELSTEEIGKNPNINIETQGDGKLYYFWVAEGISSDGAYVEEDSYLKVRRAFYDRNGRRVFGKTFEQNDLIVVKLTIQNTFDSYVDNVVISDILPAGFEIENPRIDEVSGTDWIDDQSYPQYRDIRDDRINLYVTAGNKPKHYYYVVRAVSLGDFKMGPVGAECMYNPEYHSYHGGGSVRVNKSN